MKRESARGRYRKRLQTEEVTYPSCFWKQLGACAALFLLIFGLKQVRAEPVQEVLGGLRSVATTEVELEETLGKLQFVGNFVPESVMVFWNGADRTLGAPFAEGTLLAQQEGWAVFEGGGSVLSGGEGTVTDVIKTEEGYQLKIRYDNGLQAIIRPLSGVRVAPQERVHDGQNVGTAVKAGGAAQVSVQVTGESGVMEAAEWLR